MNLALVGLFAAVFALGALRWRQAVVGALVLAVFEGALRKWVFAEEQQWVYLVKDVLLLGAYARFFSGRVLRREWLLDSHPANGPLLLLGLLGLLQLANPALPNLGVGLFGIKAYLMYVPLLYLVPATFTSAASLRRFWLGYLALSVAPLALGPIQFASPPDSVLNQYAWADELAPGVAVFGHEASARITGTFSYMSGYTAYLVVLFLVVCALVLFERRSWSRWWLYALLALILSNLMMTGSRGPFLILGAAVPALLLLAGSTTGRRALRAGAVLCVSLPLVALLSGTAYPEAYRALLERARQNEDVPERVLGILHAPVSAVGEAGLGGYGIGSTHQAMAFLLPAGAASAAPPAEGEWERIILEIGLPGFALVLLARLLVARRLWTALRASQAGVRPFLATALVFSLMSLPGSLVFNHTAHLLYWFLAGLALIPDAREARARVEPGATAHER